MILVPVLRFFVSWESAFTRAEIRWKSRYLVEDDALFGISDDVKLFGNHERISCICLYFDGANGSLQSVRMCRQILSAKKRVERAIAGGSRASIPKNLRKYLSIEGEGAGRKIVQHYEEWDKGMAGKGYSLNDIKKILT